MTQALITHQEQDIVAVREYEKRIAEFLPGAKDVPQQVRLAMAQIAIAHGLDPFVKEVWPIPQKDRNKNIVGWDLMIGISGWRAAAWRSNEYWGRRFEKCTDEERKWMGAQPNDIALKCIVMRRRTGQQPMEFDGYGLFRVGQEYSKMNPLQCARYRAERDAMKAAFPISLPVGVQAKIADEETGEIINGTHGVEWTEPLISQNDFEVISSTPNESGLLDAAEAALKAGVIDIDGEPDALRSAIAKEKTNISTPEPLPERPSYRMANVRFDNDVLTVAEWHSRGEAFASDNDNWQKDGRPDMNHILASAGHAGYQTITSENVQQMFIDIVKRHAAKVSEAQSA